MIWVYSWSIRTSILARGVVDTGSTLVGRWLIKASSNDRFKTASITVTKAWACM